jgi:hypothetical protein
MPYKQSLFVTVILVFTIEQIKAQKCSSQDLAVFHDCVISILKTECASAENASKRETCYKSTIKQILKESGLIWPQDDVSTPVERKKKEEKFECERKRGEHPTR